MKGVRCFPRNTYKKYHQPLRLLSRRERPDRHHRRRGAYLHIGVQCAARADTAHLPRRTAPRLAVRRPRAHGVGARRAWERHGLRLRRRRQPDTHRGGGRQRAQPRVRRLGQPHQGLGPVARRGVRLRTVGHAYGQAAVRPSRAFRLRRRAAAARDRQRRRRTLRLRARRTGPSGGGDRFRRPEKKIPARRSRQSSTGGTPWRTADGLRAGRGGQCVGGTPPRRTHQPFRLRRRRPAAACRERRDESGLQARCRRARNKGDAGRAQHRAHVRPDGAARAYG